MAPLNKPSERASLHLNKPDAKSYIAEPMVIMSILDHHKRRSEKEQRVLGTLLGFSEGNTVHITNCFPLIHEEEQDTVKVDQEFERNMTELYNVISPKESILGWYSTGGALGYNVSLMHQLYEEKRRNPVYLCVDTTLNTPELSVKAYHGTFISVENRRILSRFETVPFSMDASISEKIGVDVLISGRPDDPEVFDSPSSIIPDVDSLQIALADLLGNLEEIDSYVDQVVKGTIPEDRTIGRAISHALAAVPHIDSSSFEKMFAGHLQDMLMVVYLASQTQTQLAIADKIGQVLK
eukprot:167470_1